MELLIVINKKLIFLVINLFFINSSFALNGSYKTFLSESKNPSTGTWEGELTNTFRPKFSWSPDEHYTFYLAYAVSVNALKKSAFTNSLTQKQAYRAYDLNFEITSSNRQHAYSVEATQNLDRFYMSSTFNKLNINLGRAPVAFGSSKIINPTDVLTPISYQTLDKEERIGIDTLRFNYSLGALSLVDVGVVFGDKLKKSKSAAFTRLKVNLFETDISAMLMDFQENLLTGLDLARSIGKASAWWESAIVFPKYFKINERYNTKKYFRSTLGMDYKLTNEVYSYVEYHFNGAGESDPKRYLLLSSKTAFSEGGVSLLGVHYIIPGMTYELTSLWKVSEQFLYNVNDASLFNNLSVEHNIAQDIFIDLGTYLPFGEKTQIVQKSEFGIYPKILYSSLRFYF